jgi:hypothetical protein
MKHFIVVAVLTLSLAASAAQADRLRYGAGDPAQQVVEPAPVRGDPDVPTRQPSARTVQTTHSQPLPGLFSPCQMCEDSSGNAAGACMLCGVIRRFASLGGW